MPDNGQVDELLADIAFVAANLHKLPADDAARWLDNLGALLADVDSARKEIAELLGR